MWGWAFSSRLAPAAARSIIRAKPAVVKGDPRSLTKTKGESASPSVERLAHLIAKRYPPDSIGAEPNLLSQTQTHAVRLGTSAGLRTDPAALKIPSDSSCVPHS